ncbi:MAG: Ig-like domain-containing protein [Anaerocolumna sp.]
MRKNFFKKKLASTLALAMVVTSLALPTSASAATVTKVVKQGGAAAPTVLYVGTKGTDYGLSKVYKGNKYAWTISNSAIATINKAGVVTAKAPGVVTIKCTARNSKGTWLKAFTKKLTIKQRVDSVDVGAEDFSLFISETKDLNAVKDPASSTDSIRYYSDNTEVATVNAKNGVVTAVGVGEATITVYAKAAWNTATASKYNRTDAVKVTVKDGIQSIKQTTTDKVELTFGTDQSQKLTTGNLIVTDGDGAKQVVKDISFSADGKTATVEFYLDFEDGASYKLAYADTEKSFTASVGDVAKIELKGKTVQYDTNTDLDYAAYDKNGVDVSSNVDWESDVDFDYEDSDADLGWDLDEDGDDGYQINVYDYPDSIDVEMTYSYYDEDAKDTVEFTSKAVIKSVEEITKVADDIQYTLADSDDADSNDDIDWDGDLTTNIAADSSGLRLFVSAEDENGDDITEVDFDSFTSTDDDILTVSYNADDLDDNDPGTEINVYPEDEGTAYIKAVRGDTTKLLKVTVGSEAKAKSIKVDDSSIELYSTLTGEVNGVTVDVDVLDQYGDDMKLDIAESDVTQKSGPSASPIECTTDGDKVTFYLDRSVDRDNDGSYTYKIEAEDKTVNVNIKVINVTDLAVTDVELVSNDSDNEFDVALEAGDGVGLSDDGITFYLYGLNEDGDRVGLIDVPATALTIYQDGDLLGSEDFSDEGFDFSTAGGVVTFTAINVGSEVVSQASVGTYKIKADVRDVAADSNGNGIIDADEAHVNLGTDTLTFKVTDSQDKVKVTQDETTLSLSDDDISDVESVIGEAFTFKFDGDEIGTLYSIDAHVGSDEKDKDDSVFAGNTVRIDSVKLKYSIGGSKYILLEVDVNKSVRIEQ